MQLPFRQVHLDFHTSRLIPDVGVDFDPEDFAKAFADAHVNSVTVFAKCHHGNLYYNTDRRERHPGLDPSLDLLREQIEALHASGIRAPIYISVQCDEYAANEHPEWLALDVDGKPVRGAGPFSTRWQILDMSSPYQEYLAEQTREVLEKFHPVDGIFFDMCWDQPSLSKFAIARMLEGGLDPERDEDRMRHSHDVALAYMQRFSAMVREASPQATVFFNGRPTANLPDERTFISHVEIEALPTGGWGYLFFPTHVRFARNFDRPYIGMTARFHKGWADFGGLKPLAALRYETVQMLAHGGGCSIGDQLHPRGPLDSAAYQLIGDVYRDVERCEKWCAGAKPQVELGVLMCDGADEGAVRMLTQLRHQFDLIDSQSDLSRYELIVLPDAVVIDESLALKLREHVARGGALLASGTSGLSADGESAILSKELGIVPTGLSPFTATYVRVGKRIETDIAKTDHVMYERSVRVAPAPGATSLAVVVEPYFERSWQHFSSHRQTPPDKPTKFSTVVMNGRVAYIAYPIFGMFARHGSAVYRTIVGNVIDLLLPEPMLRVSGPTGLEATVLRQDDRTIAHLLYFPAERRAENLDLIEDIVPLRDIEVSLRSPVPSRAHFAPDEQDLKFEYRNGRVELIVPELRGHAMIVLHAMTDRPQVGERG